jgi:hypothetical protein
LSFQRPSPSSQAATCNHLFSFFSFYYIKKKKPHTLLFIRYSQAGAAIGEAVGQSQDDDNETLIGFLLNVIVNDRRVLFSALGMVAWVLTVGTARALYMRRLAKNKDKLKKGQ